MLIDIHAHLHMLENSTPAEVIARARVAGVSQIITIATQPEDLATVDACAKEFFPSVLCTLGIHPHEAGRWTPEIRAWIAARVHEPYVAGLGEMGLDCFRNPMPIEVQQKAFIEQLELAEESGLPVEIHSRDAEDLTAEILHQFRGRATGVLHCFTGTWNLAKKALDAGFNISISGIVTFKNAQDLRDVVLRVPLDRLHVETDSPYLAPVPHRGKKNEPEFVVETAKFLANLHGLPEAEFFSQMTSNARTMFKKLENHSERIFQ